MSMEMEYKGLVAVYAFVPYNKKDEPKDIRRVIIYLNPHAVTAVIPNHENMKDSTVMLGGHVFHVNHSPKDLAEALRLSASFSDSEIEG